MALSYKVSRHGERVHVLAQREVSTADCIRLLKDVLADATVHPHSTALIDMREAVYMAADKSDILRIAETIEGMKSLFRAPVALVAKGDLILFAELLATHVRNHAHIPMRVFADISAAEAFCSEGRPSSGSSPRH